MSVVTGPDNLREEKISLLIRRYEKDLLRTCCIYLRDKDMAQDAVQETFFKAYKALDSFRGESTEKTWLYSIAFNVCRDMRRSAWFRYVDMRVTLDHLPDPVEPASEASIALMQEIMRLPRKLMETVWLYYYEDMNMKEIGDMLGVAATTVGYRLDKARALLRRRLKGGESDEK